MLVSSESDNKNELVLPATLKTVDTCEPDTMYENATWMNLKDGVTPSNDLIRVMDITKLRHGKPTPTIIMTNLGHDLPQRTDKDAVIQ